MTLIARPGSYEQVTRAYLDAGTAHDIAFMLDDVHTILDWLAHGQPETARQAAAVLAEVDSPYNLHDLAAAVDQTAARVHRAVRDALAEVPDHIPGH
jgi:hypothetical protein